MEIGSIIDEVRRIRVELGNEINNDINAMTEYLRRKEQEHPERLVVLPEHRWQRAAAQETPGDYAEG